MGLSKAQIGRCGEALVQYRLLLSGIESAPMMTDTGIDLVAYFPGTKRAITIQVKANLAPKSQGGRGHLGLDWWIPKDSPAEMVALVDLQSENIWLIAHTELLGVAQQQGTDRLHFYFYVGDRKRIPGKHISDYEYLLLPQQMKKLLAAPGA
jgi:hypothetical protein